MIGIISVGLRSDISPCVRSFSPKYIHTQSSLPKLIAVKTGTVLSLQGTEDRRSETVTKSYF